MSSPSEPPSPRPGAPARGAIHDIGYRPYTGPRLGTGAVARSLFGTGLRHCYGLGRSGKSKVLPILLLAAMLLPALIIVAVMVQLGLPELPLPYTRYAPVTSLVITVFVASQAPVLISRDLRFRTITLYAARPLPRSTYVLVRLASLATGVAILILTPIVVLYLGALLADLPVGEQTVGALQAAAGAIVLAVLLACLAALVSAVTTRRGIAVTAVIVVLLVSYTVVSIVQGIALAERAEAVGQLAGLFSPFTLVDGLQTWLFETQASTPTPPEGTGTGLLFVLATVVLVGASVLGLLVRYRKVG